MSVIVIDNLSKRYGSRVGIDGLNLSVEPGEVFGFLGPNGSGKSTTIRTLMSFLRPSDGRASIFGLDCWREGDRIREDVGYLPGDLRLYPWLTPRIALQIFGEVRGVDLREPGLELARRLDLEMDARVSQMSRGMRQKLGLILALAHEPELLILDEPTSALDPLIQNELYRLLRERADGGATVFLSSHTLSEVESLCDRVAILRKGRLIVDETLAELRRQARRTVCLQWSSGINCDDIKPPPSLRVLSKRDHKWECTLDGDVMELVQWVSGQALVDITISAPNLERVFGSYYEHAPEDG